MQKEMILKHISTSHIVADPMIELTTKDANVTDVRHLGLHNWRLFYLMICVDPLGY